MLNIPPSQNCDCDWYGTFYNLYVMRFCSLTFSVCSLVHKNTDRFRIFLRETLFLKYPLRTKLIEFRLKRALLLHTDCTKFLFLSSLTFLTTDIFISVLIYVTVMYSNYIPLPMIAFFPHVSLLNISC